LKDDRIRFVSLLLLGASALFFLAHLELDADRVFRSGHWLRRLSR
jgi:hypothetical protein